MIVSLDTFVWVESVRWVVKLLQIVPPRNSALEISVPIPVPKPLVDPMLNVPWWTREPNVHVYPDFYPTPRLLLDALVNLLLVYLITNVPLDSNAMPNSVAPCVTAMTLVFLTNCVLITFVKRSARVTMIVDLMRSVKVSNVCLVADLTRIVHHLKPVKITNVSILAPSPNVESTPFA